MTPGGETPRSGDPVSASPPRPGSSSAARTGVAVTGLGVVSPLGLGVEELWSSLVVGRRALSSNLSSPWVASPTRNRSSCWSARLSNKHWAPSER